MPCSAALSEILSYHCNKYYVLSDFRFILNSAQSPFNWHKTKASNRISSTLPILLQIFSYAALKGPWLSNSTYISFQNWPGHAVVIQGRSLITTQLRFMYLITWNTSRNNSNFSSQSKLISRNCKILKYSLINLNTEMWDVMPCSPLHKYQYFERTCYLCLPGRGSHHFYLEDRGSGILWNTGAHSPDCKASHTRTQFSPVSQNISYKHDTWNDRIEAVFRSWLCTPKHDRHFMWLKQQL